MKLPAGLMEYWPWLKGKLPDAVSVVFILLLALTLARLSWQLVAPAPAEVVSLPQQPAVVAAKDQSQKKTDRQIAGLHMFGVAEREPSIEAKNAPETQLNLTLLGVLATAGDDALAIIESGNNDEKFYRVGSEIPGGATLEAVYADRVLLERNGRKETLKLPKSKTPGLVERTPQQSSARSISANVAPARASQLRKNILKNPARLGRLVAANPVQKDGQFVGFKLSPRNNRQLFQQLGLRDGDVVTSVNGIRLNSPAQGAKALQDLVKADSATVTLLRNGNQRTLHQGLSQ